MMFGLRRKLADPVPSQGPVLDLSGDRLRRALADLDSAARPTGGVERYVTALELKAALFAEVLGTGGQDLTETEFLDLAAFITPIRRKVGTALADRGMDWMRLQIARLMDGAGGVDDTRLPAFCAAFPQDKAHRWVRDLGAELLHFTHPDVWPLMTRWVWDARVGSGVLREIWHADDVDAVQIIVPDDLATFQTLRAEIEGFLAAEGVFRDRPWVADLLQSHIYAGYINDAGGQYLRNDFTIEGDPMQHTRRMLGLDGVDTETGRTRLRLIDGTAHQFGGSAAARLALLTGDDDAHS